MSLAFQFKLTPGQSRFLLACAFGHYSRTDDDPRSPLLPEYKSPFFLATANSLIAKGLIDHDARREPTYQATAIGVSIANMIVSDARRLVELADTARRIPKIYGRSKQPA